MDSKVIKNVEIKEMSSTNPIPRHRRMRLSKFVVNQEMCDDGQKPYSALLALFLA